MSIIDKSGLLKRDDLAPYSLELGCGQNKRHPDCIGIDLLDHDCVDIVGDVFDVLRAFPDASVRAVYSHHFVEHVDDLGGLMNELSRVLQPGGKLDITVPHFSNPHFYSDYTHRHFFGLYSFDYFCRSTLFVMKTPNYGVVPQFDMEQVRLNFRSFRPYYLRHGFKKLLTVLFNSGRYMQELYEENLAYLFPCYEIRYVMTRLG